MSFNNKSKMSKKKIEKKNQILLKKIQKIHRKNLMVREVSLMR